MYPRRSNRYTHAQFLSTTPLSIKKEILNVTEVVKIETLNNIQLNLITPKTKMYYATERDLPSHWESLPWWSILWPGGYSLTKFLLNNKSLFENKNILDFACGCGISSIAAKQVGAKNIIANDIDPNALVATELNWYLNNKNNYDNNTNHNQLIQLNGNNLIGDEDLSLFNNNMQPDTIIAGDIFYDDSIAKLVLPWFQKLKKKFGTDIDIYFGDPDRWCLKKLDANEREKLFTKIETVVFDGYYRKEHNGISESYVYKIK